MTLAASGGISGVKEAKAPLLALHPEVGRNALGYSTLALSGGEESNGPQVGMDQIGFITRAIRGSRNLDEWNGLYNRCSLGVPKWGGRATKCLSYWGPQVGGNQMGYITPSISGSLKGEKSNGLHHPLVPWYPSGEESNGLHHPCRLGVSKWGGIKWSQSPLPSRGPSGEQPNGLHHPYRPGIPKWGAIKFGYITQAQVGRIQMGCITPAVSRSLSGEELK